jgi:hypothetical protein
MGIANGIRKQAKKIAIGERHTSAWAQTLKEAAEELPPPPLHRLERTVSISAWPGRSSASSAFSALPPST